jgi:hypothetical protein
MYQWQRREEAAIVNVTIYQVIKLLYKLLLLYICLDCRAPCFCHILNKSNHLGLLLAKARALPVLATLLSSERFNKSSHFLSTTTQS